MLHLLTLSSCVTHTHTHTLWILFFFQKVLSEMQTETQQRLKVREQELKDMKKMMEGMKVGRVLTDCVISKPEFQSVSF